MQLSPILAILAILIHSEMCSADQSPVGRVQWLFAILTVALSFASSCGLSLVVLHHLRSGSTTLRLKRLLEWNRVQVASCIVAAVAVEYVFHWSRFVRINLELARVPLLHEAAVLTPFVVCCAGTWIASHLILKRMPRANSIGCWNYALYWPFEQLKDEQLKRRIHGLASSANIALGGTWIWKTDRRNAFVLTLWPLKSRLIMTEGLLKSMDSHAVCMLVAHELGHVKRRHGLYRLIFALVPLFLWQASRWLFNGANLTFPAAESAVHVAWISLYMIWVFGPLCHRLEHAADNWACRFLAQQECHVLSQVIPRYASMLRELHRHPRATSTATWLHPHLFKRVVRLTQPKSG